MDSANGFGRRPSRRDPTKRPHEKHGPSPYGGRSLAGYRHSLDRDNEGKNEMDRPLLVAPQQVWGECPHDRKPFTRRHSAVGSSLVARWFIMMENG